MFELNTKDCNCTICHRFGGLMIIKRTNQMPDTAKVATKLTREDVISTNLSADSTASDKIFDVERTQQEIENFLLVDNDDICIEEVYPD